MATSSLYKDFVITTREEAEGLVNLLDEFNEKKTQTSQTSADFYEPSNEEMNVLIKKWREKKNA